MKEKELRIALVCYSGVSLVLYMQGVTKEVLKLVRASKAFHSVTERAKRSTTSFSEVDGDRGRECDTETIYFSILQTLSKALDLRIIVDSVAGSSAGGISAIILARALAHDLSTDHLRSQWLTETDVLRLLAETHRARMWSKWFLYPLLWIILRSRLLGLKTNTEVRRKLSTFFRSRWFEAPFDGDRFLGLLFDGLRNMRTTEGETSSLLPPGHPLDLAVCVTDFFGYSRRMEINTPHTVQEREHALLWKFRYCRSSDKDLESDLNDDSVAGLALAARATSSVPGAFPPAQIGDVDRLLASRNLTWASRSKFMAMNFREHRQAGTDPMKTAFVDGALVDDKPWSAAIDAVRQRTAHRHVDRRLVYIDPDPQPKSIPADGRPPNYLQTLEAATFDIPLRTPIRNELEKLARSNNWIKQTQHILTAAWPEIEQLISDMLARKPVRQYTSEKLAELRREANALAGERSGYAYQIYARSRLVTVLEQTIVFLSELSGLSLNSRLQIALADELRAWAERRGIEPPSGPLQMCGPQPDTPPWIAFLLQFDRDFRHRRTSLVVQALSRLSGKLDADDIARGVDKEILGARRRIQKCLDPLTTIRLTAFVSPVARAKLDRVVASLRTPIRSEHESSLCAADMDELMDRLGADFDLGSVDAGIDATIASILRDSLPEIGRRDILTNYLGFSFWDVWTFPISAWHQLEEHREVRIDRISPSDASALGADTLGMRLKGAQLRYFAGFFSRSIRENDYLWGRLNGAERLIDIVCNAAELEDALIGLDVVALKKSVFLAILETEDRCLEDKTLLADIRKFVEAL